MIDIVVIDGVPHLDGQQITLAEAEAAIAADPEASAYIARQTAQRQAFDLLNAATVAIREWSMDTQAWLYTQGASGTFDQAGFLGLVQQAETAGLAFNALPSEDLTPALIQEQAGMSLRGQQAQILHGMALAAVMG